MSSHTFKPNPALVPQPEMLKFNLSLAMAGERLITRDGHVATRFTASQDRSTNYPVRAVIDGKEQSVTIAGTFWIGRPDALDLFMAAE